MTEQEGDTSQPEATSIAHATLVLVVGLAISIPIVLAGGDVVARLMGRLPILAWVGGTILAYTAGELIAEDEALNRSIAAVPALDRLFPFVLAILLVGIAAFNVHRRSSRKSSADVTPLTATNEPSLHMSRSPNR